MAGKKSPSHHFFTAKQQHETRAAMQQGYLDSGRLLITWHRSHDQRGVGESSPEFQDLRPPTRPEVLCH
jgi:hypothetical protein